MKASWVVLFFFAFSARVEAHSLDYKIIKDLEGSWMTFTGNHYQVYDPSSNVRTIYFLIDADLYKGAFLRVECQQEFSMFLGGRLISSDQKGIVLYDIDSLSARYSSPLDFSIRKSPVMLSTKIVMKRNSQSESEDLVSRKPQYFLDFSIMASLILLVFFVALLRTNPKLTFDYLNFVKLFSAQEREENIMTIRITSSANLLFYTFASLLTAFLLMVIFHFAQGEASLANIFQVKTFKDCFFQWVQLTVLILFILLGKLMLISIFSYLYKVSEITALQFFNFVRLFFFTFGIVSLLIVAFFMGEVLNPIWYYNLFYVAAGIFIFWEIIIFLKLMTRLPFRIFHLFFYLCASELIPLVILLKVVFY